MNVIESISDVLLKVLNALEITTQDVVDEAEEAAEENPEVAFIAGRVAELIKTKATPFLGIDAARKLASKVADEIMSGEPGYDPQHGGIA